MSNKLRNIDAIKKMIGGTHHSQTKKSFGYKKPVIDELIREVGDTWIDENGNEWVQQKGFKIKKGKLDEIRELIKSKKLPSNCPKCSKIMDTKLDKKFWALEGHCFECQISFEHNLKIEGKYEEYEKNRMLKNAESWLKDAEQEAYEIINALRDPVTYANSDGRLENWYGGRTPEEIASIVENEFKIFKENFINKLKEDLQIKSHD